MDQLIRFSLAGSSVRGGIVRLDQTLQEAQKRRRHPALILSWLGESMAAASLLATNIQLNGSLVMQIQSEGYIQLLVTEVTDQLGIRATAHWENPLPEQLSFADSFGLGQLVLTLNFRASSEFYQGITELQAPGLGPTLEHYLLHAEQLETRLWLQSNSQQAAGLLLQKIPTQGGQPTQEEEASLDHWETAQALARTVQPQELLINSPEDILRKLFFSQGLICQTPRPVHFFCSCSPERVTGILKMLGEVEVQSILEERGNVEISCDFCGQPYRFDPAQALAALKSKPTEQNTSTIIH